MQPIEPVLRHVACTGPADDGPAAPGGQGARRMAYWEWNATGNPAHPHVILCVHGLSRQGRDFDVLARALAGHARVVCPDVAGRGHSDWLQDPAEYGVPRYAADMLDLIASLHATAPVSILDWVGTSMGGLIGMVVCGQPGLALPVPVRRLVLNDVGPVLQWSALQRIGSYLGRPAHFSSMAEGALALRALSAGFGPHTEAEWRALSDPMLRREGEGWKLHYDPAIALPFAAVTEAESEQSQAVLWGLYDRITAETLLLRGAQSDLLSPETAQEMAGRGPRPRLVTLPGVGHAPTLVAADQVAVVKAFLLGSTVEDVALPESVTG